MTGSHVADNLNEIVNNYWNSVVLDGNPWTWSNTRNRMQTTKFKVEHVCVALQLYCIHIIIALILQYVDFSVGLY
jgi:hypothetical protein